MIRALWVFTIAMLLGAAVVWLVDVPGYAVVDWRGYRIETNASLALVLLLGIGYGLYLVIRFVHWIGSGPKAWRRFFARLRNQRGMGALAQGLAAAAAGDTVEAGKAAAKAERLVVKGPLPAILALEAAILSQNETDIQAQAAALTNESQTALLGWRALYNLAQAHGEDARATACAEAAFGLSAGVGWAAEALIADALSEKAIDRATASLDRADRGKAFPADRVRTLRACILTAQGRHAFASGDFGVARGALRKATTLVPGFTPAAITRATLHFETGKAKRAEEIILEAWPQGPHPALGRTYLKSIRSTDDDDQKKLRALTNLNERHVESRLLIATAALDAGQYVAAREALKELLLTGRTARACALMARLALAEHNDRTSADDWIAKGLEAPRDNVWECEGCGHAQLEWSASCPRCGSVGRAVWFTHRSHENGDLMPDGAEASTLVSPEDILRSHVDRLAEDVEFEALPALEASQEREAPRTERPLEEAVPAEDAERLPRQPDDPGAAGRAEKTGPKGDGPKRKEFGG